MLHDSAFFDGKRQILFSISEQLYHSDRHRFVMVAQFVIDHLKFVVNCVLLMDVTLTTDLSSKRNPFAVFSLEIFSLNVTVAN